MQLTKLILFIGAMTIPLISYAEQSKSNVLNSVLARYEVVSNKCSKHRIFKLKTENAWFNQLSEEDKKTATYYTSTTLHTACMKPIENELIVAFFNDAVVTNSTEKLLTFLDMTRLSILSKDDANLIERKIEKLDREQLNLLIEEVKGKQ